MLTLTGGPLLNGRVLAKISIVPIPKAQSVGVDPSQLTNVNGEQLCSAVYDIPEPSAFSDRSFASDDEEAKAPGT